MEQRPAVTGFKALPCCPENIAHQLRIIKKHEAEAFVSCQLNNIFKDTAGTNDDKLHSPGQTFCQAVQVGIVESVGIRPGKGVKTLPVGDKSAFVERYGTPMLPLTEKMVLYVESRRMDACQAVPFPSPV